METSDPRQAREDALRTIEMRLPLQPDSVPLLFARARALDTLGRDQAALVAYAELLKRDRAHPEGLTALAILLKKLGQREAALSALQRVVECHPKNSSGHTNLATFLTESEDLTAACTHFDHAIRLDPGNAHAHRGRAIALLRLGRDEEAALHGMLAGSIADVWRFRGDGSPAKLLVLGSARRNNVLIDRWIDDRVFQKTSIAVELWNPDEKLPKHDIVFNAIGDADNCGPALALAEKILEQTSTRVINPPAVVIATGRAKNTQRLATIPGLVLPKTELWTRDRLSSPGAARALEREGFTWPLLLRSPGFHAGANFERVLGPGDLLAVLAKLPGEELFVVEFVDVRLGDGKFRKYRVMMIDGQLYPLHLAVSHDWKVHYFSADMGTSAAHREEDRAFLDDMPAVLGSRTLRTLEAIRDKVALDYGGIDFAVDSKGQVVVFETNATMTIVPAPADDRWAYRVAPVERVTRAVQAILQGIPREATRAP